MIEYSAKLSMRFPFVRVDFYEINGEPVFGEMTLAPAGGYNYYLSDEAQMTLGEMIDLNLLSEMSLL